MLGLVLTVLVLAIAYCVLQCVLLFQDAKRRAGPSIPVFFAPLGVSPWTMLLDIFLTASVFRTGPLWWVTLGGLYRRAKQIWKEANYPGGISHRT
jgi:O-antigen ligase